MNIIKLLRIDQWVKNAFVYLPLFFSGKFSITYFAYTSVAFIAFSLFSSSIYCFNDIHDVAQDRLHPTKRYRPIASGKVSVRTAYTLMLILLTLAVTLVGLFIPERGVALLILLASYFIMNILYTLKLKQFAVVDVLIIALGFVLRVIAGATAVGIQVSHWIIIMTFLLALFMALAKRRDDLVISHGEAQVLRKSMRGYNLDFLNQAITLITTITIVAYIMYTVSDDVISRLDSHYIYVTSVFVLCGVLRYMQIVFVYGKGGDPTKILLKDRIIQLCVLCWILTFAYFIYS